MRLDDFNFELPQELIAKFPLEKRSASRLLQLERETGNINHQQFNDLVNLINPNDLLILNDTRVIPARLFAKKKSGGKVEILIERILEKNQVLAHVKSNKALKISDNIYLENNLCLKIIARHANLWELQFPDQCAVLEILQQIGHMPLPHYMQRADEVIDRERYQTIFAQNPGAVAAPTAGLHFDAELLQRLREKNIAIEFITLHVGAGTFQPVRVENIQEHKMHSEYFTVSANVCAAIIACKKRKGRVIAVGTTVVRSLESIAQFSEIRPYTGETKIFIYPGYQFQCVDAMITNFHLPESTLLMLVSAFGGHENIMRAYQTAIAEKYRFFSYGDAMFLM